MEGADRDGHARVGRASKGEGGQGVATRAEGGEHRAEQRSARRGQKRVSESWQTLF